MPHTRLVQFRAAFLLKRFLWRPRVEANICQIGSVTQVKGMEGCGYRGLTRKSRRRKESRLLCNHQLPASNHDLNVKCALEHVCGVKTITRPLQKDGRLRSCPGLVSPASRCSLPALTTFTSVIITRLATAITILSPRLPVTLQFFPFVIKNKPEPERRKALAEDMKPWMMQG